MRPDLVLTDVLLSASGIPSRSLVGRRQVVVRGIFYLSRVDVLPLASGKSHRTGRASAKIGETALRALPLSYPPISGWSRVRTCDLVLIMDVVSPASDCPSDRSDNLPAVLALTLKRSSTGTPQDSNLSPCRLIVRLFIGNRQGVDETSHIGSASVTLYVLNRTQLELNQHHLIG